MGSYLGADMHSIQRQIVNHVEYTLACTRFNFDNHGCYQATALSIRDRLIESWNDTQQYFSKNNCKRVYYLSLEFLLGRMLQNALINIDLEGPYRAALDDLGYKLEDVYDEEVDPGLGNGGLGRLAACFLDSLATLEIPAWGYGIRYNYGIFKQEIRNGYQVEVPDYWLARGNPWEVERTDIHVPVHFYGRVERYHEHGVERSRWVSEETVVAMPYDTPIPGYNTFNTNNLRLWRACPSTEFDFRSFNSGDYFGAVKTKQKAESITSVLYPNDQSSEGKELRLKQEYFFCAATLHDIIRRYRRKCPLDWKSFPDKVAIQLNDTHPAMAILELLRLLMDEYKLPYPEAMAIVGETFSYTNHTILPEALERWDIPLFGRLLPRHLEIAYLVNHFLMESATRAFPGNGELLRNLSCVEESEPKRLRMANLCVAVCHQVNGVAALHTEIIRNTLFRHFVEYFNKIDPVKYKDKFLNVTNGVTPRRWIACANPLMTQLITQKLGHSEWIWDLSKVKDLERWAADERTQEVWKAVKRANKLRLAAWIRKATQVELNPDALFDVMVKRIHEYKRQLMNILYVVHRYLWLKDLSPADRARVVPRATLFGGKAAPGYDNAKKVIKLIGSVSEVVNNDKDIGGLLKVVFMPNYSVSNAQLIIPGSELSQHISTAGTEASGTSNMKFVMNGCLIIGTMDGANVEIAQEIGKENMFVCGGSVQDVASYRKQVPLVPWVDARREARLRLPQTQARPQRHLRRALWQPRRTPSHAQRARKWPRPVLSLLGL